MPNFILAFSILMMMIISGCNNPSGGSVISRGNAPLLKPPSAFNFTQIRAANGTAELKWKSSYRADNYKVYMGTSAAIPSMTEVSACTGLIVTCTVPGLAAGLTYYFNVVSSNAAGNLNITSLGVARTVGSFDILTSTIANGQIDMTWSNSANATSYAVKYGTAPGNYTNIVSSVTSPYSLTGLSNGRTYYFKIVATNANNGYIESDSEGSGTPIGPPDVPANLTIVPAPAQMNLTWSSVTGATSYDVYRGLSTGALASFVTGLTSPSYVDSSTTAGITYFYSVRANNALYSSVTSAEVSSRSISNFAITSVVTGGLPNQLVVSWPYPTGADNYTIRYGLNAGALTSTVTSTTSPVTITGLVAGTTYYFRITASNAIGSGASVLSTNTLSGVPLAAPVAPSGLTASATPGSVLLNWNAVAGAASYEVFRGNVSGTYASIQSGVTSPTWTDATAVNGSTYFYVVKSFNGLSSANSNEVTIKPVASFALTAVNSSAPGNLTVTWPAVAGGDAFDVLYRSGAAAYTTILNVNNGYTITGLTSGTTYYVAVRAKNAIGAGSNFVSAELSAIPMTTAPASLTATSSSTRITLTWPTVAGALTYKIYRSTTNGGPYSALSGDLAALTYDDVTAPSATTYYYVVTAKNGSESAYSPQASARNIAAFAITAVTVQSSTSLQVSWPAPITGAATYDVRYRIGTGAYTTVAGVNSPYPISGLTANTSYNVSILAKNAVGTGATEASAEVAAKTATIQPIGLVATTTTGLISLAWTATPGATDYKIFRGTTSGSLTEIADNIATASYPDSSVVNGTQYFYAVVANNGADSIASAEATGRPIAPFTIDSLTALSPTSIRVNWSAPLGAGATYDILYRSTGAVTTIPNVSLPNYTITGLSAGTTYYIAVRAKNAIGTGTTSTTPEVSQVTPIGPPTVTLAAAPGQVTINWTAVAGATNYRISRGTVSGTYGTVYSGVTGTSYVDTGLTNGQTYFYVMETFNGAYSALSTEVSVRPIQTITISATSATANSVTVMWNDNALGAASYDIEYRIGSSGGYTLLTGVASPWPIPGLAANTTYEVRVLGKNAIGLGTTFTSATATQKTATAAPTALVATSSASGTVGLNWTAATGATSYKIFRRTVGVYDYNTPINTVVGTAFLDTGLTNGTIYYYEVRANNGADSLSSNEVSLKPISTPFTFSTLTAASSTSLNLTWVAATGADTYRVVYGLTSGSATFNVNGLTGTSYTLTALSPNTQYFVRVIAENAVGTGVAITSNELNSTTATAAPVGLVATTTTPAAIGQISLSWTPTTGATNYNVYRSTTSNSYGAAVATGVSQPYVDTNIVEGTTYYYKITSFNGAESPQSNEQSGNAIDAFSVDSLSALSPTSIRVDWSAPAGAGALYDVLYRSTGATTTISNVSLPNYTLTGLSAGTTYYISIRAKNSVGNGTSKVSAESSQVTPIGPPTVTLSAQPGQVTVGWNAVGGATNYRISRGIAPATYSTNYPGVTGTSYVDNAGIINGQTYYYAMETFNGAYSAYSTEVAVKPIANVNISGTTATVNSVTVTWNDNAQGADAYDVEYRISGGGAYTTLTNRTSPFPISGLAANTSYDVRVVARNAVGAGTSFISNVATQLTPTAAPANLVATSTAATSISLTWDAVAGATYKIFRSTTAGTFNYATPIATQGGTGYLDTGLTPNVTYYYVVRATNGSDSVSSNQVSRRPVSAFSLSTLTAASSTSLNLTWTASTGADNYKIQYGATSGVYTGSVDGVTGTSTTLTGLTADTLYYVNIISQNASGTALASNELNARTKTLAPAGLTATATTAGATGVITLNWTATTGASSYNIYRSTTSASYGAALFTGQTGTSYADSSVTAGTVYYYVITANNGTESAISGEAFAKTIAAFSVGSTSAASTVSIVVNWTNPLGGDNFDILYRSTGATTTISNVSTGAAITGLTAGTNYFISVRARNSIGGIPTSTTTAEVSQITPIAPPATITASNTTLNQVTVGWSTVVGATNYRLYRSTTSNSYGAAHAVGLTGTSTNDSPVTAGTTYYYRMTSFNGAESAPSSEVSVQPIASFTISASVLSSTSIQVNWTNPAGGATYDLSYGLSPGSAGTTLTGVSSGVALTGLSTGTTYYITVTAKNAIGAGSTRAAPEIGAATAFGAPSGLVATASPGSITLNWNAVTGAATYSVSRKVAPGAYAEIATGLVSPTYTDPGRTNGITYDYVVRALDSVPTSSADSAPASAQPISTFTLNAAATITASGAALSWGAATGAASYDVFFGTATGSYGAATNVAGTSHSLTGLIAGTTYFVKVVAKNSVTTPDTIVNSNEISFTTSPAAVTTLAVTSPSSNSATLTWTAPASATGLTYTVRRGTVSGTWGTTVTTGLAALTYTDIGVLDGTSYYYIVVADNGTPSVNSSEVSIKPMSAFSISSTSALSTTSIQVNWTASTGADNYDVYIGTSSGSYGGSPAATVTSAFTTATLTGLTAGTNYYIQVRARNAVGTGTTRSSAETTRITPIGPPTITVTATPTVATVSWGAVSGATSGYRISRGTSPGTYDTFFTVAAGVTTRVDTGLTNGQAYYYAVQSDNGSLSALSTEVGVRPIASFTVTSTVATATSINVRWNADVAVTGATTYDVSYRTGAAAFTVLTNQTSPYLLTGLTSGTSYDIRVTANNSVGGNNTAFTTAVATQLTALAAPVLSATATPTQVNLSWTSISASTNYRIYRATTSGGQNYGAAPLATITHPTLIHPDTTATPNGTTYYYTVRSFNGTESVSSNEFAVRPINSFTQTAATSVAATSATLNWGAAAGAASYDVYLGTTSGTYGAAVNVAGTSHPLTGLLGGTTYFARITAKNTVTSPDTTVNSNEISFTTAPAAIMNLVATSLIPGRATLNWSAPTSATSVTYTIRRGTVSGTWPTTVIAGHTTTSYNNDLLVDGTQYFFNVTADNGTVSANSNETTIMPIATPSISAKTALSTTSIKVDWASVAGAATYEIWMGTSTGSYGGTAAATVSSAFNTATITGLSSGTTYYIQLRALNTIGAGATRSSAEVTQITPIAAPVVASVVGTPGQAILTWNQVTGATGYRISRGTSPTSYDTFYTTTGQSSVTYTNTGLTAGTIYYYAVQSDNGALSTLSTEVSVRPIASFSISSTSATASTLTVTWNAGAAVTGAASYDVLYRKGTDAYTTVAAGTNPYTITGLLAGTSYDVQVVAKNTIGTPTTTSASSSAVTSQLTSLGAPTISTIVSTNGQVVLTWTNTGSSYKIFRRANAGAYVYGSPINSPAAGVTTYTDSPTVDGTTYQYVIRSFNGSDSVDSNEVSVVPVAPFTIASITPISASRIDVTWNAAAGATSYDVYYKLSSGSYGAPTNVAGTSLSLTGLAANSLYNVYVVGKNALGTSGASNTTAVSSAMTAPAGITDLALNANDTSATVGAIWTNVTGATQYRIYRGATAGTMTLQTTIAASGGATTGYTDTSVSGIVNGNPYFYSVRPFNGTVEGADSNIEQIKPLSSFTLTAATTAGSTSVNLTWGTSTGADTYDVYYGPSTTPTFNIQNIAAAGATTYTLTGLNPATLYYITVRARNLQGTKVTTFTSNQRSFTTGTAAPVISAIAATPGSISLSVANSAGATNYNVYRGTATTGPYSQIASAQTSATFTDAAATSGTTWYYMVRAFNGVESSNSNELFAQPIANFTITASSTTPTTINVTWASPLGGATYDVNYKVGAGAYTTIANRTSPYTITGLTTNVTYTVMVTAKNAVGVTTSVDSSTANATTPLAAPTGLVITGGTSSATLNWTANASTTYKVYRGTVSGSLSLIQAGITGTSFPDSGLTNGLTYYYAIVGNNGTDSALSPEVATQPISAFSISSITGPSTTSIQVTWGAATGATAYTLRWGTVSGTYPNTVATAVSPYTITGLVTGTTYYVQILATNAVGTGTTVASAQASGTPNSAPILSNVLDQTVESEFALPVAFTLSDTNDVLTCAGSVSGSSSNTTIIPNANIVMSGTIPNCTATITSGSAQTGTAIITLTATDGKTPVSDVFNVVVTPCAVNHINWETQPTGMAAGSLFGTAPRVSLRRANNSLCTTNLTPVTLAVSVDTSNQQDAAITGIDSVVPSGGFALFNAARMERAGTNYQIIAEQDGVTTADSSAFSVSALAASKLTWDQDPLTAPTNAIMLPNPSVRVTDLYGNWIALNNHGITVSLQDNTEGATLSGTLTKNTNASGSSIFTNLKVNLPGSYYLRATSGTYGSFNSPYFDILSIIPVNTLSIVEMVQGPLTNTTSNLRRANSTFGTNYIDGTPVYTWRVIATNSDTASSTVTLRRGNTSVASVTVPASTTVPTLFTANVTNGSFTATANWFTRPGATTIKVHSSKLIAAQTDATKTQQYIPLTSIDVNATTPYIQNASTTASQTNAINFTSFLWDPTEWARIDSATFAVAHQSSNTAGQSCVSLWDKTAGTQIREVCIATTTESMSLVTLIATELPATATEIEVRHRTSNALYPARLYKAGLYIRQVSIEKTMAIQIVGGATTGINATNNYGSYRASSWIDKFGTVANPATVSEYLSCRARASTVGSGSFMLITTTSPSTTVGTTVNFSNISYSNQTSFTKLESAPFITTPGNNVYLNYTHTSGDFELSNCLYKTQAVH